MEKIIEQIRKLEFQLLVRRPDGKAELASPSVLSEVIVKIAILLSQLTDWQTNYEIDYKNKKSKMLDELLKEGIAITPALNKIDLDEKMIELKTSLKRIENHIDRTESLIMTVQSHIKLKGIEAQNNL